MKSVFVVIAALAATAVAQLPGAPDCSTSCVNKVLAGLTSCSPTDIKCVCESKSLIAEIGQCLGADCSPADLQKTISVAYAFCQVVGVTIPTTIPTAAATTVVTTGTGTSTVTSTGIKKATSSTSSPSSTSTGAAATNLVSNGLGVAGAAAAAFLFL